MKVNVKKFITGPIETNTYLLSNDKNECIIFDPSIGCERIFNFIEEKSFSLNGICFTHGHFDHIIGINEVLLKFPDTKIWAHRNTKLFIQNPDLNGSNMIGMNFSYNGPINDIKEGQIKINNFEFTLLHIPGHSPGCSAFIIGKYCFCGDTLFAGGIGRTDLHGSDGPALLKNIKEKLLVLPNKTIVCPGHGGRTTIGRERQTNPFFI